MNKNVVPKYIEELLGKIIILSKPVSVFLYGSMTRGDFENDSDYEIGIIFKEKDKLSRSEIQKLNKYDNVKIYPFVYEELIKGEIDSPFPKYFYLRTILETGEDLFGEKIKNIICLPELCKQDMYESLGFCLGRAYSAITSSRQNDLVTVRDNFTKSGLYGLQLLIFAKKGEFVSSYIDLVKKSKDLIPYEFVELIKHMIEVRKGFSVIQTQYLYKNISFLNKVVLLAIKNSNIIKS